MARGVYPRRPYMKSHSKVKQIGEESIRLLYRLLKDSSVHPMTAHSGGYAKVGRLLGLDTKTVWRVVKKGGKK